MNEEADPAERATDLEAIVTVIRSYMK